MSYSPDKLVISTPTETLIITEEGASLKFFFYNSQPSIFHRKYPVNLHEKPCCNKENVVDMGSINKKMRTVESNSIPPVEPSFSSSSET